MKLQTKNNNQTLSPYSKKILKAFSSAIDKMLLEKARNDEKIAFEQNGKLKIVKARKVLEERGIKI
jgi:hypothetical protein